MNSNSSSEAEKIVLTAPADKLNKNKFTSFDKTFDDFKFNTVKPTKTSVAAAFGDDPFGDTKNNNAAIISNNNGGGMITPAKNLFNATFDDDFTDAFANIKLDGAHGGLFDKNENPKAMTVGAKAGRGYIAKQKLEADFSTISKQDFSPDDNFGEVLAQVLERSKLEK